jgi:putative addiction module component (TIGR02574 family)
MTQLMNEILKLSPSERISIVEAIWDSLADKDTQLDISAETKQLLDKRLEEHHRHPEEGSGWNEVKARIKKHL